jgi:hypothetical protein
VPLEEFSVNESMIHSNEVSSNRSTHKTKSWIDQLIRMLRPEAHRILTLTFC